MRLARSAYVDLCFVIAWGSRYNVSIEYVRPLPSLPARPVGVTAKQGNDSSVSGVGRRDEIAGCCEPRPDTGPGWAELDPSYGEH